MTFKVNDRVVKNDRALKNHCEYEGDDDTSRGVVKEIKGDKYLVKWDPEWSYPNPSEVYAKDLVSEEEAEQILAKLEAEYEVWAGPIREKIEEAAKLLSEAGKLAEKQKRDLAEMHEIVSPLLGAMDDIGWRTSSLSC